MPTAKEELQELLDRLPNEVTYEEIQYHFYVRQKVNKGIQAANRGEKVSHEQVVETMRSWTER